MCVEFAQGGVSLSSGVTCIIPVWNCEKYIAEALNSIALQTHSCASDIVVDDGSTDCTAEIVSRYENLPIEYIRQINQGPAAARNRGLSVANTEFVAFLDSDDLWHQQKLEKQIECLEMFPELPFCISHVQNFWSPELSEETKTESPGLLYPWIGQHYSALLARRSAFDRVGLLNPQMRLGEDIDWFVRAAQAGASCKIVPEVLTYRRLHPGNLSRQDPRATRDALLRTAKQLLNWKRGI